jgi:glc operon protein GlcG
MLSARTPSEDDMDMKKTLGCAAALAALVALAPSRGAAQQLPNLYGDPIGVEAARKAAAAAIAEGKKNNWRIAVAVVDTHGELVFFERMDGTQYGSMHVAEEKARTSARFKRTTKTFEDAVKGQAVNVLGLPGAVPLEGGLPLLAGDRIVGAIGVSGATSAQDGQCARAAADAIGSVMPAAAAASGAPSSAQPPASSAQPPAQPAAPGKR